MSRWFATTKLPLRNFSHVGLLTRVSMLHTSIDSHANFSSIPPSPTRHCTLCCCPSSLLCLPTSQLEDAVIADAVHQAGQSETCEISLGK